MFGFFDSWIGGLPNVYTKNDKSRVKSLRKMEKYLNSQKNMKAKLINIKSIYSEQANQGLFPLSCLGLSKQSL